MSYFENRRNPYHNLEAKDYNNSSSKSVIGFIVICLFLVILLFSLWNMSHHHTTKTFVVMIDTKTPLLHKTSPRFLSFGLDSSLLRNMEHFPVRNNKFATLARHLSPAYVRIGGTSADCLIFEQEISQLREPNLDNVDDNDVSNFTLNADDYLAIYEFTKKAQLRMMFDLNVLIRDTSGHWNDSNACDIINFSKGHDMEIDWQLGNEPNSFHHVFNQSVSAQALANDYQHLRELLNQLGYESSIIVGPEANHIGDANQAGQKYILEFLETEVNSLDFVTWHQYYLNGRIATVNDFVDPKIFNRLPDEIDAVNQAIAMSGKNINMWISETSTAYGGGAPALSDRFVAGFLWLDKLGYSASSGVNVVIRQSFFGGNYAMVGPDLEPNPDWWLSVIFKQLVSSKVLKLTSPNNFGTLRMYAHCTPDSALITRVPAVTVYGMNIDKKPARISILGNYSVKSSKIFLYVLTADYLEAKIVRLNGEPLKLNPDGSLPAFKPIIAESSQTITLPPFSMVFIVIHGAQAHGCAT